MFLLLDNVKIYLKIDVYKNVGKFEKIKFDFWIVIYFDKFVINYFNEGS